MGGTVMETSVETWDALAALLKYGPLAVVWTQVNSTACGYDTFDTVIRLRGDEILQRTYCQEKPATATRRAEPAEFRFGDTFPRDRAPFAHWVYLKFLLDLVEYQHRLLKERTRPADEHDGGKMLRIELLDESERLVECLLSSSQLDTLLQTAEEIAAGIENPDLDVDLASFWKLDASIGGIGGYCLLSSMRPFRNPFLGGIARELFRSIQYAAAEVWYHNGPNTARSTVWFSGMHLEAVTKYWVSKTTFPLNANHYERSSLGQNIGMLKDSSEGASEIFKPLDTILTLYNPAKHKTPQDRERMFTVGDALVVYVSSRILSTRILRPYYDKILHGIPEHERRFPGLNKSAWDSPSTPGNG
jgi:hypothetical protein